jgi:hypothetical protein
MTGADFNIIFWFTLGIFTLGAAILATYSLINVIRLRNVRMSWKAGKMKGYPFFSSLFTLSAIIVGSIAVYQGTTSDIVAAGLYFWLGICWFTASYFSTKRFVTDHGIVKNVNEPSQTVAWHQIRDFVEKEGDGYTRYIFIYGTEKDRPLDKLIRLELDIPDKKKESFQKLVSHKLGNRIRCYINDELNIEQFKRS